MITIIRAAALLAAALALSGCSTVGKFDNVLARSLSGDRAFTLVLAGPFGFTLELREADAQSLDEMQRARDLINMLRAQAAARAQQPAQQAQK